MLLDYDYDKIMQHCHGNIVAAIEKMELSINLYFPARSNFIARRRCKSAILILRRLRFRYEANKTNKKARR